MTAAANNEDLVPAEWRYAGQRTATGGGTFSQWYDVDDADGDDEHSHTFKSKKGQRSLWSVGAVYRVMTSPDGQRAALAGAEFVRMVDDDARARWVAEDRAHLVMAEADAARRAAKRTEAESVQNMTIRDARNFIEAGTYTQQAARLAIVLKALGAA